MVHDQIKFLLLDPCTNLRKYLEYEISAHGSVDCLTWRSQNEFSQSDLPLLSGASNFQVILNLLPLISESSNFFNEPSLCNSGLALKHGLIGSDKLLAHFIPFSSNSSALSYTNGLFSVQTDEELFTKNPFGLEFNPTNETEQPVNIACFCLTDLIDSKGKNSITSFLEECLRKKKPKVPFKESFYPLNCRIAAKLLVRATLMCYWNPSLSGFYEFGPNGTPSFEKVLEFALNSAKKLRPELHWASHFDFVNSQEGTLCRTPDLRAFQDAFEIILPDWKDCVLETVSGFVANLP